MKKSLTNLNRFKTGTEPLPVEQRNQHGKHAGQEKPLLQRRKRRQQITDAEHATIRLAKPTHSEQPGKEDKTRKEEAEEKPAHSSKLNQQPDESEKKKENYKQYKPKHMSKSKTAVKSGLAFLLVCACLVTAFFGFKVVSKKLRKPAVAKISLTYQKASSGLNPNGTRFDPYMIVSDDVLEEASKELGYTVTSKEAYIGLTTSISDNYATDYYLNYIGNHNGAKTLEAILKEWKDKFEKTCTSNEDNAAYEKPSDENLDYIYMLDWLSSETNQIASYSNSKVKNTKEGWSDEDKNTFKSIYDDAQNILNVDIANLKTYIVANGVTKDASSLKATIAYKDKLLENKKANYDAQYENRRDAIKLYDPTLFPTISVPSQSSGNYYVTTTKTGLDYIYDAAATAAKNSADIQNTLDEDRQLIANVKADSTQEQKDHVEKAIKDIETKISDLGEKFQTLNKEYKETQEEPYFRILIDGKEADLN